MLPGCSDDVPRKAGAGGYQRWGRWAWVIPHRPAQDRKWPECHTGQQKVGCGRALLQCCHSLAAAQGTTHWLCRAAYSRPGGRTDL